MAEFYTGQNFLGSISLLLQAVGRIVGFGFDELAVFRNDQVLDRAGFIFDLGFVDVLAVFLAILLVDGAGGSAVGDSTAASPTAPACPAQRSEPPPRRRGRGRAPC